jgi:hypothetical protein
MSKRQRVEWPDTLWIYGALSCRGSSSCTWWHIQIIGTGELFSSLLRDFRRTAGWKLPGSARRKHLIVFLISASQVGRHPSRARTIEPWSVFQWSTTSDNLVEGFSTHNEKEVEKVTRGREYFGSLNRC